MSAPQPEKIGKIIWTDLTVADAAEIREFYSEVVGWKWTPHDMGEYADYNMLAPGDNETVTGICHARGTNSAIPPQWLIYIAVADVDRSAGRCVELGGRILDGPRPMGAGRFCVIQDPAGAVAALFSG